MVKVANPPPKPLAGALPTMGGAPDEECRGCVLFGLFAMALSGALVGFILGFVAGRAS